MTIEMKIKGLMIDPITNMPIVILKDAKGKKILHHHHGGTYGCLSLVGEHGRHPGPDQLECQADHPRGIQHDQAR